MVQSVYNVSKPTCRELHPGDCLLGVHSFFLQFPNHSLGVCLPGGGGGGGGDIKLRTYFQGTARVGCCLFIRFLTGNCLPVWSLCILFPNLPAGDCRQGVHLVLLVPNLHPGNFVLGVHS